MGRKLEGSAPFLGRGGGSAFNTVAWSEAYLHTKWHLNPSSCLATTDMGRKLGGLTQCAKTYLHAKFHLDPSNRLANVTDRIDRTQSNSITNGRPKPKAKFSCLLRHPAWKCRGPILILALHKFVIYLLRHPLTYSLRTHTGHGKPHKKYLGALWMHYGVAPCQSFAVDQI